MVELKPSLRQFLKDQSGAVTIEFTTLVPFFFFMLVLFADASVVYLTHSEMFEVARDVSRRMSTGELADEQAVVNYAAQHLFLGERTYTVDADFGNNMRLAISVPVMEAAIFGLWFRPLIGKALVVEVVMSREPRLVEGN